MNQDSEIRLRATADHRDRKSTRLNSSHGSISYAVFCMTKKRADFKRMLSRPGPWMFTFYVFGECLPNRENYIELDKEKADAWGIPALKIHCSWRENERALLHDMTVTASEMLSAAGAKQIEP